MSGHVYIVQQCQADEWITLGVYASRPSADRAVADRDFPAEHYGRDDDPLEVQEWPLHA